LRPADPLDDGADAVEVGLAHGVAVRTRRTAYMTASPRATPRTLKPKSLTRAPRSTNGRVCVNSAPAAKRTPSPIRICTRTRGSVQPQYAATKAQMTVCTDGPAGKNPNTTPPGSGRSYRGIIKSPMAIPVATTATPALQPHSGIGRSTGSRMAWVAALRGMGPRYRFSIETGVVNSPVLRYRRRFSAK